MRTRKWYRLAFGTGLIAMSTSAIAITAALAGAPDSGLMRLADNNDRQDQRHDQGKKDQKPQPAEQKPQQPQQPQRPPQQPQQPQRPPQQPDRQQQNQQWDRQQQNQQRDHQQQNQQRDRQQQNQQRDHQQQNQQWDRQQQNQQWDRQQQNQQRDRQQQNQQRDRQQQNQQQRTQQRYDWNQYRPGSRPAHTEERRRNFNPHEYERNYHAEQRYHGRPYQPPRGWYYRQWSYGQSLPFLFFRDRNYWIEDYWDFGLVNPPYGFIWVRSGDDALLVDVQSGFILSVAYGLFY